MVKEVLGRLNWMSAGYMLFRITSDVERLPFPMAPVAAAGATALAEAATKEQSWRWRVFSIGTVAGLVFGFFYVAIPVFTGVVFNRALQLIPIPFFPAPATGGQGGLAFGRGQIGDGGDDGVLAGVLIVARAAADGPEAQFGVQARRRFVGDAVLEYRHITGQGESIVQKTQDEDLGQTRASQLRRYGDVADVHLPGVQPGPGVADHRAV